MKRFYIIASLLIGAVAFSACEEKLAEPVFNEPTEFVLNNPVLMNQPCDLAKSDYIELVCSQPDYGFTAATTYQVQVSLDGKFENPFDAKKITGDYVTIGVDYTNARINVTNAQTKATIPSTIPMMDSTLSFTGRASEAGCSTITSA